ncbi:MAG: YbaB/EbfC family nucleoid-associated protein [Phycicoccus sp.]
MRPGRVRPAAEPGPDDEDLDDVLARIEQRRRSAGRAITAARRRSVTGRSPDDLVAVTVDGRGRVCGLEIDPDALHEHDHASLAAGIVQAWQAASTGAARQLADSCPEVFAALAPSDEQQPAPEHTATSGGSAHTSSTTAAAVTAWARARL